LFGAAGWPTKVHLTPFVADKPAKLARQEFIAIDRFTGGGADGLKFDAGYVYQPVLHGVVTLHLGSPSAPSPEWFVGLMALVLRDLVEGDLTFGYGAAKGYGACTATLRPIGNSDRAIEFVAALQGVALGADQFPNTSLSALRNEIQRRLKSIPNASAAASGGN